MSESKRNRNRIEANIQELTIWIRVTIKRKPFPLPKISDLWHKLEGFTYATSLDLTMGYYHIVALTPEASKLCAVVLPWGKYEYLKLPMGLCNSPDFS